MTREETIRLAKEAGFTDEQWRAMFYESGPYDLTVATVPLERFAALVAQAEREACARVCEEIDDRCPQCLAHDDHDQCDLPQKWQYAAAIRARKEGN